MHSVRNEEMLPSVLTICPAYFISPEVKSDSAQYHKKYNERIFLDGLNDRFRETFSPLQELNCTIDRGQQPYTSTKDMVLKKKLEVYSIDYLNSVTIVLVRLGFDGRNKLRLL